jgi:hypothetical protein
VLAFFSLIASRITTNKVRIQFRTELRNIDENQLACVNRLLQIFREKIATIPSMHFDCNLSSLQFLADADNKMKTIKEVWWKSICPHPQKVELSL